MHYRSGGVRRRCAMRLNFALYLQKRKNRFYQTPIFYVTKVLRFATKRTTEFNYGIYRLRKTRRNPNLKNVQNTRISKNKVTFYIIPINVRLTPNMFLLWKKPPKNTACNSNLFDYRVNKPRKARLLRLRLTRYFSTENILRTNR